jgi:hypothetical protein
VLLQEVRMSSESLSPSSSILALESVLSQSLFGPEELPELDSTLLDIAQTAWNICKPIQKRTWCGQSILDCMQIAWRMCIADIEGLLVRLQVRIVSNCLKHLQSRYRRRHSWQLIIASLQFKPCALYRGRSASNPQAFFAC